MKNISVILSFKIALAIAISLVLTDQAKVHAQVSWAPSQLLYTESSEADNMAPSVVDAVTDDSSGVMSVWLTTGDTPATPPSIMTAASSDFTGSWLSPRTIESFGSNTLPSDVNIVYLGSARWLILWAVERPDTEIVDFYQSVSTDFGANWSAPEFVTSQTLNRFVNFLNLQERDPLDIASDGNNTVVATFRGVILRSTDGGANWSAYTPPVTMRESLTERDRWSRVAYAGNQQWIHAYHRASQGIGATLRDSIYVSRSQDNGLTWASPTRLDSQNLLLSDLTADAGSAIISADGFGVRNSTGEFSYTFTSTDAGSTWTPPKRLTDVGESLLTLSGDIAVALVSASERPVYLDRQTISLNSGSKGIAWSQPATVLPTAVKLGDLLNGPSTNIMAIYEVEQEQSGTFQRHIYTIRGDALSGYTAASDWQLYR